MECERIEIEVRISSTSREYLEMFSGYLSDKLYHAPVSDYIPEYPAAIQHEYDDTRKTEVSETPEYLACFHALESKKQEKASE